MSGIVDRCKDAVTTFSKIKTSLANKGVSLPDGLALGDVAKYIRSISQVKSPETNPSCRCTYSLWIPICDDSYTWHYDYTYFLREVSQCETLIYGKVFFFERFYGRKYMKSIKVSLAEDAEVDEEGEGVFHECTKLETVVLDSGFGVNFVSCRYMFDGCTSLRSIEFPSGFGKVATSAHGMFMGCASLETITGDLALKVSFSLEDCPLSAASIQNVISSIQTLADGESATLTLGKDNLDKITTETLAIAMSKGWNVC